jgi:hypothetical protein
VFSVDDKTPEVKNVLQPLDVGIFYSRSTGALHSHLLKPKIISEKEIYLVLEDTK